MSLKTIPTISLQDVKLSEEMFKTLGAPTRLCIIAYITREKRVCVSDIAKECGISIAAASQHTKALRDCGLVLGYREKRKICFEIPETKRARSVVAILKENHL